MPYSKEHTEQTRMKILKSAFELFAVKGFDAVTVNGVMKNCNMTRGAFYAHFKSKAALYGAALKFGASRSKLAELKPDAISDKVWLTQLLDGYLSHEHVNGTRPCPLAFLATDIVTKDEETKRAYANTYKSMNDAILAYANSYTKCTKADILSLTAMIIGAVAISRTIEDQSTVDDLLSTCRKDAKSKLGIG